MQPIELVFKRSGKAHDIKLPPDATVLDLKKAIEVITHIPPQNQNLLGVAPPRAPPPRDEEKLIIYNLRKKQPIMMLQVVDQYKKHKPNPSSSTAHVPPSQEQLVPAPANTPADKIAVIQGKLDHLVEQLEQIGHQVDVNGTAYSEEDTKAVRTTLDRQTEFLTQTLISLDGIDAPSEREKRREQIRRINTIQDKIDAIKSKL